MEKNIGNEYRVVFDEGEEPKIYKLINIERGFMIFESKEGEKIISRPTSIFYIEDA